jgi:hypothetical protein
LLLLPGYAVVEYNSLQNIRTIPKETTFHLKRFVGNAPKELIKTMEESGYTGYTIVY